MNIAGLISSFATGTYTVTRKARGAVVRGRIGDGTTTTVTIRASVSPASGADIVRLMQGRQVNSAMTIFTTTELMVGGPGATYEADVITIDGATWELNHVEKWTDSMTGNVGYKCIATDMT